MSNPARMSNHEECESTMIGATLSRASAARRRYAPALAGLGLVALAATACGGGGGTTSAPPAAAANSPAARSSQSPSGAQAAFPGVVGTAAAVSGSSMEVQNPSSGQVTVTFSTATAITETVATTSKDVTVGSCVAVVGQSSASGGTTRSVAATSVTISTPVNGSCRAAGGFGFGSGGPRGTFSPRPGFTPRPRPSGSRGAFGAGGFGGANGAVTSLSASGFVVQARNPRSADPSATASITVTTSSATKYLKVVTARPSALKVGQCIIAVGQANSIGTVAARTIRISQPGPNGCVAGFGRRGGFGGGGSGGATSNA